MVNEHASIIYYHFDFSFVHTEIHVSGHRQFLADTVTANMVTVSVTKERRVLLTVKHSLV